MINYICKILFRTSSLSDKDEKHLLATQKAVQQLEEEETGQVKKPAVVKTTSSLAQSNVIKKNPSPKSNLIQWNHGSLIY